MQQIFSVRVAFRKHNLLKSTVPSHFAGTLIKCPANLKIEKDTLKIIVKKYLLTLEKVVGKRKNKMAARKTKPSTSIFFIKNF